MSDILTYNEALPLLQEADIALFRNPGFPSIGWAICAYTRGIHSHVGLISLTCGDPMLIEQREFKGGRSVDLETQINKTGIDVYRICPKFTFPDGTKNIFDEETALRVTQTARRLTGHPYGWKNIWGIFKGYAPFFRLLSSPESPEDLPQAFVCSTVVAYSYHKNFVDLCPNVSDDRTSPADISRSGLLRHVFTIKG